MGLFDTIRRAVGGDSSIDGDETTAGNDRPSDDGPELLDTATLDPPIFREYAERVVDGADPLTFDPAALARLDTAIEESYGGETVGDAAGTTTYTANTVRFGSYLGELLVRAYDGEWVQSDGRWGVTVAGPDDEVAVAVFDVAARSFGDEPVFAAVVTRLKSELALDTGETADEQPASDTDSAVSEPTRVVSRVDEGQGDERDASPQPTATDPKTEAAATDTADQSRPIETEPTRVISRVTEDSLDEAPSDGDETDDLASDIGGGSDAPDSTADDDGSEPPAVETAGAESTVDSSDGGSATEQSAADTADEQPTAETSAEASGADSSVDGPAGNTTDAVETTAGNTAATAAADEAATYIDEAEPTFDSATADPSDEAPAAEESALDSSPDTPSVAAPDTEGTPKTDSDDPPADTADVAGSDDAAAADASDAEESDDGPDTSAPAADVEPTDPSERAVSPDVPADEMATDGSTGPAPTDGDSAAGSTARSWEPGTVRADHADTAVEFADFWGEHDLDFSPTSLSRLDDLVDAEWDGERFAETTFGSDASFDDRAFTSVVRELGGYFGEVLVRYLDGEWTDETDHEAAVVVGGPGGQFAVPVFEVAITSLRKQAVFGRSYDALLDDLGRDGPTR